jgi:hypothetical protein
MKTRILIALLFVLGLSVSTHAQNCSYGQYQLTDQKLASPPCNAPPSQLFLQNTYAMQCINSNNGVTYWNSTSTMSATGQNYCYYGNNKACVPIVQMSETNALIYTDYNRFYNRAYTYEVNTTNLSCTQTNFLQDFQQCIGKNCGTCHNGCGTGCTPIVLDTTGQGFSLTDVVDGVSFDLAENGIPEQMSWTARGSGVAFLALPGLDGLVHNGKQLFGNRTPQPPSDHPNGFAALAVYDLPENGGNGDGLIDARDAIWTSLRLWVDNNPRDGICQIEEMHTLREMGINSISLHYTKEHKTDQYGNVFVYKAPVDGVGHEAQDVIFVFGTGTNAPTNIPTLLPNLSLPGSGTPTPNTTCWLLMPWNGGKC